jgi:UDP-glucuronate 4-epimerase
LKKILVTGAAGFIGMHLSRSIADAGNDVIGIDNFTPYYDVALKKARVENIAQQNGRFKFFELDIAKPADTKAFFSTHGPFDYVVHLAAQAGVRYSLTNPFEYEYSNSLGFLSILEACRSFPPKHLLYASSSSVYGANTKVPFVETDPVESPVSLYAATKRANELAAHTYSRLFKIPTTGLRFFTVYGPWGRPDMAYWSFAHSIKSGKPIPVFGNGQLKRDFTFVDDIVSALVKLLDLPLQSDVPARILNVGNSEPVAVSALIEHLEKIIGRRAICDFQDKPLGDVEITYSDSSALERLTGFAPSTPLPIGLAKFFEWFDMYETTQAFNRT